MTYDNVVGWNIYKYVVLSHILLKSLNQYWNSMDDTIGLKYKSVHFSLQNHWCIVITFA